MTILLFTNLVFGLVAALLALPIAVFVVECLLGMLPWKAEGKPTAQARAIRVAVLVPAHNEEKSFEPTIRAVLEQLGPGGRCLVVADNCTDETAEIARNMGTEVLERFHPTDRGKGFAIKAGLDYLAAAPPEVVIIVDADCGLGQGALATLAHLAMEKNRPVQADYILLAPQNPTPISVVSALAFLVRNRVRPLGLRRIGLPCHLTGTGMAFPWDVIRKAPPTGAYLVEDLLMGIELAMLGYPPLYTSRAHVTSVLPSGDTAARKQRTRWEHGQLTTLLGRSWLLGHRGILGARIDLLALGLDLMVPPLALLVATLAMALGLAALSAGILGTSWTSVVVLTMELCALGLSVLGAWARFARSTIPVHYLLAIPFYVAWKIPLYLTYLLRGKQATWERTERPHIGP